ncbi:MAG: phosphatase PAP2 family protein [bacterium]
MLTQDQLETSESTEINASTPAAERGLGKALTDLDVRCLSWFNRQSEYTQVMRMFRLFSRIGDGVLWYSLIAVVFFQGYWQSGTHLLIVALVGLGIYKILKISTRRYRPFHIHSTIKLRGKILDDYSFPSGHTLHAASLTAVTAIYFPTLALILTPVALLIACSRCVLGLHYPSDVLAGAAIGLSLAWISTAVPLTI